MGATSFNQDISGWDVSNVTNMSWMFAGNTAFQQPLDAWQFNRGVNLSNFMAGKNGARAYNTAAYDALLAHWVELDVQVPFPSPRSVNMGGAVFTGTGDGGAARDALLSRGWTIVDGGPAS